MSGQEQTAAFEALRERVVDYLYDQIDASGRRAIEAAMAENEDFRREVEALARTLRISRRALLASQEPVPARVRSTVLAAAAAKSAQMRAADSRQMQQVAPDSGGLVADLWRWMRQPWAYPVMAAAAVFAIFVLARDVIEAPKPVDAPTASPQGLADETVARKPMAETAQLEKAAAKNEDKRGARLDEVATETGRAQHAGPDPSVELRREEAPKGAAGGSASGSVNLAYKKSRAPSKAVANLSDDLAGSMGFEKDIANAGAHAGNVAVPRDLSKAKYAEPPPGYDGTAERKMVLNAAPPAAPPVEAAPAPSRAAAPASVPPPAPVVSMGGLESASGAKGSGHGAGLAPASQPAPAKAEAVAEPFPAEAESAVAAKEDAAPQRQQKVGKTAQFAADQDLAQKQRYAPQVQRSKQVQVATGQSQGLSRAELLRKADELLKAGRFDEAAAVYRELVRRFPQDVLAVEWRNREQTARLSARTQQAGAATASQQAAGKPVIKAKVAPAAEAATRQ